MTSIYALVIVLCHAASPAACLAPDARPDWTSPPMTHQACEARSRELIGAWLKRNPPSDGAFAAATCRPLVTHEDDI